MHADGAHQTPSHKPGCDVPHHTQSQDCATPIEDTYGLLTHIAWTGNTPHAYLELRDSPLSLTSRHCREIAVRFATLGDLLDAPH